MDNLVLITIGFTLVAAIALVIMYFVAASKAKSAPRS